MTAQFARTPYRGRSGGSTIQEPHAALLIDFDNVTMGIRSDLTKELKNLLNSDIIKGKVAVQRAYADWRRYPQYIVPLAESSVDLIFAPAYGSAKKNATDIRLAIDAVELVFTRPEIGTIILLSGDSDFSSLVLKLKEYGKYVIGVGIRESASDLLVQNCDEYYSYSALTGLTRAGDEAPVISEDPWELVEMGLKQMIDNDDVMRSDRLKQVLLEMDPSFDEKALGFQKFNKFLQEAANRGIISLRKQENGQYEVGPPSDEAIEAAAEASRGESPQSREGRSRRGRRGRGRREEREPRRDQLELGDAGARPVDSAPAAAAEAVAERDEHAEQDQAAAAVQQDEPAAAESASDTAPAAEAPAAEEEPAAADERGPRGRHRGRGRRGPAEDRPADTASPGATDARDTEAPAADGAAAPGAADARTNGMAAAYDLLRRAVTELVRKGGPAVRDSDVKRRMLELQAGWDEASLGFSKFSRFLRTAHDAEVVTLRKGDNGVFDVLLGDGGVHVEADRDDRGRGRDRDRGRGRGRDRDGRGPREDRPDAAAASGSRGDGQDEGQGEAPMQPAGATQATTQAPAAASVAAPEAAPASPGPGAATAAPRETQATPPAAARPQQPAEVAPAAAVGFRRGSRGRPSAGGPPPLLEGQTAPVARAAGSAGTPQDAQPAPAQQQPAPPASEPDTSQTDARDDKQPAPTSRQRQPVREPRAAGGRTEQEKPSPKARETAEKTAAAQREAAAPAGDATQTPDDAQAQTPGAAADTPAKQAAKGTGREPARQPAGKQAAGKQAAGKQAAGKQAAAKGARTLRIDAAALGLPTEPAEVVNYMSTNYKGVGPKSVQTLIDTFGADKVYDALETQQDRVREVMGNARGETLIDAFADDIAARRANAAPDSRSVLAAKQASERRPPRKGPRPAQGGSGRGPAKTGGRGPGAGGSGPGRGGPDKPRGGAGGGRRGPRGKAGGK